MEIDMAKEKYSIREKIFKNVKQKFSERFNVEEKPYSESSPDIVLYDKTYGEAIFDMFIIEPNDQALVKLDGWKKYLNNRPEKHYIITPKDKADEVKIYSNLISEDIAIATYIIREDSKIEEIIYE